MNTIYAFFADGFEEIEAFTAIDVLKRAGLNVEMVTVTEEEVVMGAHDIPVICDSFFKDNDFNDADMLLLPGGMPGAATLSNHEGVKALVTRFAKAGKPIAAICAAPMVLGKMGLLKGKKVTCYPGFEQYLEGATCTGAQVEVDNNIITAIGPGASMDFALTIVDKMVNADKVAELKEAMCVKG
ncbi:DJ-1/PfpI family protein [Bacteroides sp. OttesenSCG-928-E20]|nr:DJ-1/PfpI family protein [Bacteroides sp. OttesenSCG-928-E20]MDL2305043.1 DJ-1/PfpI family protein [Bacteroides sp. OttesenSCG-928-D19]